MPQRDPGRRPAGSQAGRRGAPGAARRRAPGTARRASPYAPLRAAARATLGASAALLRRFGLSLAFVLAGLLGGLGYALLSPTTYTATAFVLVVEDGDKGQASPAAVSFAQAYGRLAPLPETLAHSSLPLPRTKGPVREHVQASTSPDIPLIRLSGRAGTPRAAAAFANAAADALVRYGRDRRADTGVRVALMTPAAPPAEPSAPNLPLGVAAGTASGVLLAGLSAAVLGGRRRTAPQDPPRRPAVPAGSGPSPGPEPADRAKARS